MGAHSKEAEWKESEVKKVQWEGKVNVMEASFFGSMKENFRKIEFNDSQAGKI